MDPNEFLFGSSVPSARFNQPGDFVAGYICTPPVTREMTAFGTGELLKWPSGEQKYQVVVTLQTDQRDPSLQDDDGRRCVYIKGKNLTNAVKVAVRTAGARGLSEGGWMSVSYTNDDMTSTAPIKPKVYAVQYQAPQVAVPSGPTPPAQHFGQQAPAYPQPPRPPAPPQQGYQPQPYTPATYAPAVPQPPAQRPVPAPPVYLQHEPRPPVQVSAQPVSPAPAAPQMSTLEQMRLAAQSATPGDPWADQEPPF